MFAYRCILPHDSLFAGSTFWVGLCVQAKGCRPIKRAVEAVEPRVEVYCIAGETMYEKVERKEKNQGRNWGRQGCYSKKAARLSVRRQRMSRAPELRTADSPVEVVLRKGNKSNMGEVPPGRYSSPLQVLPLEEQSQGEA